MPQEQHPKPRIVIDTEAQIPDEFEQDFNQQHDFRNATEIRGNLGMTIVPAEVSLDEAHKLPKKSTRLHGGIPTKSDGTPDKRYLSESQKRANNNAEYEDVPWNLR